MKKLGGLQIIPELPRRRAPRREPTYTKYLILVGNFEELVNFLLQEIFQPLDQLRPDFPVFSPFRSPLKSPIQYPLQSPRIIMVGNVPPNSNHPNPSPTWRARTPLNLVPPLHALPQNVDKSFPNFDPGKGISMDDHL